MAGNFSISEPCRDQITTAAEPAWSTKFPSGLGELVTGRQEGSRKELGAYVIADGVIALECH